MITFIMIVGLPGSGKTTLANNYISWYPGALLLDDLSRDFSAGIKLFNESGASIVIITDPLLCGIDESEVIATIDKKFKTERRKHFKFIYFTNDPEQCILNSRINPKPKDVENFIRNRSKKYTIPDNAIVYPVYKPLTTAKKVL